MIAAVVEGPGFLVAATCSAYLEAEETVGLANKKIIYL